MYSVAKKKLAIEVSELEYLNDVAMVERKAILASAMKALKKLASVA
jgi:hypothetical protein